MIKICLLTLVILQFNVPGYTTGKYAEGKDANARDTTNLGPKEEGELKNGQENLEDVLHYLHSLLKDPVDKEHDDLVRESSSTHTDEWTIQIHTDDEKTARDLADSYGFDFISKLGVGDGVFRFLKNKKDARGNPPNKEEDVIDAQRGSNNEKREDISHRNEKRESFLQDLAKRLGADERVLWYKRERILKRVKRKPVNVKAAGKPDRHVPFLTDPQFYDQWYIYNGGQTTGPARFDSNIIPVWNMGYTGKDVTLSVLDDGMDYTHPDLIDNYDAIASTDLNGHDSDPFPNDSDPYNAHGTKCCGTIAAKENNSLCGVGIAFNANIGAIRMLDGKATDGLEANALSFHRDHIDIYSCSWGPKDNGRTFGRPGRMGRIALAQGAKYGRGGLGSLFVWATGNGGRSMDDCNADGYVNSIYTMGIGSVNEHGVSTYYGERCSSMFAVTYCSGRHSNNMFGKDAHADVITTYLHHQCTKHFVGTSSAAPLAAGIFALVLEANRNLTWRDMQHLLFHTTKITSPLDDDWQKNGCGKHVNHKFGFGLLDAYLLVNAALNWTTVPEQRRCHFKLNFKNGDIPSRRHFKLDFTTDGCQSCSEKMDDGKCKNGITKLEHVVVNVTLKHRRRGDLSVQLISAHGTVSELLRSRIYDSSPDGLIGWKFMTVFNWCENPSGTWQLVFKDNEPTRNREARDYEEEYINYLDTKKRAQEMKRNSEKGNKGIDVSDQTENKQDDSRSINAEVEKQKYGIPKKIKRAGTEEESTLKTLVETVDVSNDAAKKRSVDAKDIYDIIAGLSMNKLAGSSQKDEISSDRSKYYHARNYQREENDDPYRGDVYRRNDGRDGNYGYYYYKRARREAIKRFDIDEEHEKRMQQPEDEIIYEDPILKKSILAGEVMAISVTFYGTS